MEKNNGKVLFKDFLEYWKLTKSLNQDQRDIIFKNLPMQQQKRLKQSYKNGGWQDLMMRNQMDHIIDTIKYNHNIDILHIRMKAISGKSHYMKKNSWQMLIQLLKQYAHKHVSYILGGLQASYVDENTVLITFQNNKKG